GPGAGGGIAVSLSGSLTVDSAASLGTIAGGTGNAGNVSVTTVGPITIDRSAGSTLQGIGIGSFTVGRGNAGRVELTAGALTLPNVGQVASISAAAGNSGDVSVDVSGPLSITGARSGISATTLASGKGGDVKVTAGGITIDTSGSISSQAGSS